jgi:2-polyprenyl-3-methyl-5-hydroxy-6-metoxy-1,4-benzoquinol methylase
MPLANSYLDEDQLNLLEESYPIDVCFCTTCGLVQLDYVVPRERLFRNYAYLTGASEPLKTHFAALADDICQHHHLSQGSFVVDIGSNDGTLLTNFQKMGMHVLGIEPAKNVAQLAISNGIDTVNNFFGLEVAKALVAQHGPADVITATNVLAHITDLSDFLNGINCLMAADAIFVIEVPYLADLIANLEFDTIYHEHLSYFTLSSLNRLFTRFNLNITHASRINVHGGSLRIYVRKGLHRTSQLVDKLLKSESDLKLDSLDTYLEFANNIVELGKEIRSLLKSLKANGVNIVGYGAPAKGNVLLNYGQIGTDILDYIIDTTPFKQGRYTPGMHIPILPPQQFYENQPDFAFLLAWNYADDILQKEIAYRHSGGKFIIPVPILQVV